MTALLRGNAQSSKDHPEHVCYGLPRAVAKWRYLDTKPPLSFRFISRVLRATECKSVDGFRCTHLSHSATSNFKGVDRKQNMYYEGDCHQWIIGCQLEKPKKKKKKEGEKNHPECNILRSSPSPCFALLSSIDSLAGRSGGGIWKATFLSQSLTDQNAW